MRRHERKAIQLPVVVSDADNRVEGGICFDAHDLSLGGAFLKSDLLFEIGEEVHVEFTLPGGPQVRARARVARVCREQGDGQQPGMGVEFVSLSETDCEAVRAYLVRGG